MFSASLIIINSYFIEKRPAAFSICFAGGGTALCIVAPIVTLFLEMFGVRGTYLMLAGVSLQNLVAAAVFFPVKLRSSDDGSMSNLFIVGKTKTIYRNLFFSGKLY